MRSVESLGLGATIPAMARPGRALAISKMLYTGERYPVGPMPIRTDTRSTRAANFFTPSIELRICDVAGSGIQCQLATPVSALSGLGGGGLGGLGVLGCKSLDLALDSLKQTMKAADDLGFSHPAYIAAKNSSVWDVAVVIPYIGNDCEKFTNEAQRLDANLRAALPTGAQALLPPIAPSYAPSDRLGETIKWVAIAGAITVGVGGIIYLVGPFVRSLAKAGARAVR